MKDIIFKKQDDAKESPLTFVTKIGRGRSLPISDYMYFAKSKLFRFPADRLQLAAAISGNEISLVADRRVR